MKWSASIVLFGLAFGSVACAEVIYVDSRAEGSSSGLSWANAYTDLQSALDNAGPNAEIWVAGGPYIPDRDIGGIPSGPNDTFVIRSPNLRLLGGFQGFEKSLAERNPFLNKSILTGLAEKYHVVRIASEFNADNAYVDGFVITGGAAIEDEEGQPYGGGVLIEGANATLVNCTLVANFAGSSGGALAAFTDRFKLVNCIFNDNSAGIDGADGVGGALYSDGAVVMANCLFHRNFAGFNGFGHAAFIDSRDSKFGAEIYTSTFTDNGSYPSTGEGTIAAFGSLLVSNSIVWGNRAGKSPAIAEDPDAPASVYFSDIEEGETGKNGNIDVNPSFASVTLQRFHLLRGSACEDAGSAELLPSDFADIDYDGDYDEVIPLDLELVPRVQSSLNLGSFEDFDCQANNVGDALELADGRANDCNENAIPDECDIRDCEGGGCLDCNHNGIPDSCDLSGPDGALFDCDGNGQIDSCEIDADPEKDCNKNGLLDVCDGSLVDCNGDGIPDTCSQQSSQDVDADGVPDCLDNCPTKPNGDQRDLDGNGLGDACDSQLKLDPCPDTITVTAPNAGGVRVDFTLPAARDPYGTVVVAATPPPGSVFVIGTTEVVVLAVDQADARVSCSFNIVVLPPTDDSGRNPPDDEECPPLYRLNSGALRVLGIPIGCGPGCLISVPLIAVGLAGAKLRRRR